MIIHVVKEGETIKTIAEHYGVTTEKLIQDNGMTQPDKLVIGEALVIVYAKQIHIVQNGDTLSGIAGQYGVMVMELLRNNPFLSDREYIYPGETIVISFEDEKLKKITTYAYALPYTDKATIRKTLPYLTYLSIESNQVNEEGEIFSVDDEDIIQMAKEYKVESIMLLTGIQKEGVNVQHSILSSKVKIDIFIDNILKLLNAKGYAGINLGTPYLIPEDRKLYLDFFPYLTERLFKEGYKVFDSFGITQFDIMTGTLLDSFEHIRLSQMIDGILIDIFQSRGYEEGIPTGIISYDTMKLFMEHLTDIVAPEKIIMGLPLASGYIYGNCHMYPGYQGDMHLHIRV